MKNSVEDIGQELKQLCDLMTKLRSPDGCGWDRKQTLNSLKPYLIEESYETIDAIDELEHSPSEAAVKEHLEELGDLLLQIVFQSEIQREKGLFHMGDVCRVISEKLIRRHPHIFGDDPGKAIEDNPHWERIKEKERSEKGKDRESVLDGIPKSMPALLRAKLITAKASEVGFDWPDQVGARAKLSEELNELDEVIGGSNREKIQHELGDVMLACIDVARHLKLDPEFTLQKANQRFESRFRRMEQEIKADGKAVIELSIDEMEVYWQDAKKYLSAASSSLGTQE